MKSCLSEGVTHLIERTDDNTREDRTKSVYLWQRGETIEQLGRESASEPLLPKAAELGQRIRAQEQRLKEGERRAT